MKKNRKIKKHSFLSNGLLGVAALLLLGMVLLGVYGYLNNQCGALRKEIGKADKTLGDLEKECVAEMLRWDEMQTPAKLQERLVRFGLEMRLPKANQIVRIDEATGRIAPNQISVAHARQRSKAEFTAQTGGAAPAKRWRRTVR